MYAEIAWKMVIPRLAFFKAKALLQALDHMWGTLEVLFCRRVTIISLEIGNDNEFS